MIGIDLVSIAEFQRQLGIGGADLVRRAFGGLETEGWNTEQLAGMWAAKEAVFKAMTTPQRMADIVIAMDGAGRPHASVKGQRFEISVSHTRGHVVAVAMRVEA